MSWIYIIIKKKMLAADDWAFKMLFFWMYLYVLSLPISQESSPDFCWGGFHDLATFSSFILTPHVNQISILNTLNIFCLLCLYYFAHSTFLAWTSLSLLWKKVSPILMRYYGSILSIRHYAWWFYIDLPNESLKQ